MQEIVTYQPSNSAVLNNALNGLEASLARAAEANVADMGAGFTDAERHAALIIEELRLVNGMDLAAILLRYKLIVQIREEALYSIHPGGYGNMEEMARDQAISLSEFSNILDLCGVVFPYIETTLDLSVAQVWEQIGKSNFREMVPVLKSLITAQPASSAQVNGAVTRILEDVRTLAAEAGESEPIDSVARSRAVSHLLEIGQLTNREVRGQLRPERTPNINGTLITHDGVKYFIAAMDEDQRIIFQRRLGQYVDLIEFTMPNDPQQRFIEAHRVPILGNLLRDLEG